MPYRDVPDDFTYEREVNRQCEDIPIRFIAGRIDDQTDPALRTQELAEADRTFLRVQHRVVEERFDVEVAQSLLEQLLSRISPSLRDALDEDDLIAFS